MPAPFVPSFLKSVSETWSSYCWWIRVHHVQQRRGIMCTKLLIASFSTKQQWSPLMLSDAVSNAWLALEDLEDWLECKHDKNCCKE
jgi:hypothetical protein